MLKQIAGQQTGAILRVSTIIRLEDKLSIYRAIILGNFNYCLVVWMMCRQMEHIQLKALHFVFNDVTSLQVMPNC